MEFQQATRKQGKFRVALSGVAGAFKTYSALWCATMLGERRAVLDSERGSASLYALNPGEKPSTPEQIAAGAGRFSFQVHELDEKSPQEYIRAIDAAAAAGYDVLVVDGASQAWQEALSMVDRGGGWIRAGKNVSPLLFTMTNKILSYPGHVIVTFREKPAYEVAKDEKGRNTLEKIGLAPIAREGMDHEFTIWLSGSLDGYITVMKSRCAKLPMGFRCERQKIPELAQTLKSWLADGVPETPLEHWTGRFRFAADLAQLEQAAAAYAAAAKAREVTMPPADNIALRDAYTRRKQELTEADSGGPPA